MGHDAQEVGDKFLSESILAPISRHVGPRFVSLRKAWFLLNTSLNDNGGSVKNEKEKSQNKESTGGSSSKQPNRFLSSDETQPIESGRSSGRSDIGVDVGPGSEKTSLSDDSEATRISDGMRSQSFADEAVHLPPMFAAGLAPETKENLERLLTKGREVFTETRTYVKENPAEAAGLIACSGAILWALLGTKPGRRVVEYGTPILSRYLATNFNQTFALQGRNLQ